MKLVSACLIGLCTTYRGDANTRERLAQMMSSGELVTFCPEQLGGLPTPRLPAEIVDGDGDDVLEGKARVVNSAGDDVTANFLRGARETLKLAQQCAAELVILKERSPSCGVKEIHDGTFSGNIRAGCGVTTALLRKHGFKVMSDEEFLRDVNS